MFYIEKCIAEAVAIRILLRFFCTYYSFPVQEWFIVCTLGAKRIKLQKFLKAVSLFIWFFSFGINWTCTQRVANLQISSLERFYFFKPSVSNIFILTKIMSLPFRVSFRETETYFKILLIDAEELRNKHLPLHFIPWKSTGWGSWILWVVECFYMFLFWILRASLTPCQEAVNSCPKGTANTPRQPCSLSAACQGVDSPRPISL